MAFSCLSQSAVGQMMQEEDMLPDSLRSIIQDWHHLPEATISAVGLAAGAEGVDEVPGALHVIRPEVLQRFSYSDPLRALQTVSGVNIQEEDGFGLRPNIGLRGSGSERSARITLMEDGVLIAPAPYTAPAAYYFPSIARMESIEILKGSSQIAFGPQTSGGAINMVTPDIPDSSLAGLFRTEMSAFGGRVDHARVGSSWNHRWGTFGVMAEYLQLGSDGFKELASGDPTGFSKTDRLMKFRWTSPLESKLQQSVEWKTGQVNEDAQETYVGLTDADYQLNPFQRYAATAQDRMLAKQRQNVLKHRAELGARWSIETDIYRTEFERNWYKLDRVIDSTGVAHGLADLFQQGADVDALNLLKSVDTPDGAGLDLKANNRSYYAEGVQHRGVIKLRSQNGAAHQVVYGMRIHRDGVDRLQWRDRYQLQAGAMTMTEPGALGSAGNREEMATAVASFVRGTMRTGMLTWTPGVRMETMAFERWNYDASDPDRQGDADYQRNALSVWLPGLGLHANLSPVWTAFTGLHRGFIPPGSSPEAKAETSANWELGVRWNSNGFSGQLVAFRNAYKDLLGADLAASGGTGSGDLFNGGSALTKGVEVEAACNALQHRWEKWSLPIQVSYTWTDARFSSFFESEFDAWGTVETGDALPYLAPHQGSIMASLVGPKIALNTSFRCVGAMRTIAGQGGLIASESTDVVKVLDAASSWSVNQRVQFELGVNNVLDATYIVARRPAGIRPGMPRLLRTGLRLTF
jgi:Fe(3+) dicitrate transport protein